MSKNQLIDEEMKKCHKKPSSLYYLKEEIQRGSLDDETLKVCNQCKTKNLHWNIDSNSWTCAFC